MPLQILQGDIAKLTCDAIVNAANETLLGGGIGTGSALVRRLALEGPECLGVRLDPAKNAAGAVDVSAEGSAVRVYLTETNEEWIVARKAAALLKGETS